MHRSSPSEHEQFPPLQDSNGAQTLPQRPQFCESFRNALLSIEIINTFGERCPAVTINNNREKPITTCCSITKAAKK
jgi:hypothetical protein